MNDDSMVFKGFRYNNLYLVDFTSEDALKDLPLYQSISWMAMAYKACTCWNEHTQESSKERHG
jgi:hypothetical protein